MVTTLLCGRPKVCHARTIQSRRSKRHVAKMKRMTIQPPGFVLQFHPNTFLICFKILTAPAWKILWNLPPRSCELLWWHDPSSFVHHRQEGGNGQDKKKLPQRKASSSPFLIWIWIDAKETPLSSKFESRVPSLISQIHHHTNYRSTPETDRTHTTRPPMPWNDIEPILNNNNYNTSSKSKLSILSSIISSLTFIRAGGSRSPRSKGVTHFFTGTGKVHYFPASPGNIPSKESRSRIYYNLNNSFCNYWLVFSGCLLVFRRMGIENSLKVLVSRKDIVPRPTSIDDISVEWKFNFSRFCFEASSSLFKLLPFCQSGGHNFSETSVVIVFRWSVRKTCWDQRQALWAWSYVPPYWNRISVFYSYLHSTGTPRLFKEYCISRRDPLCTLDRMR